jgi:uncharacterized protein YqeY
MSALKDQITEDMKTAMRAKDSERLGTIRLLLAALKQKEVDERVELVVLQAYLPARLSADEVAAAVKAIVAELGASGPGDMGKVMGAVKAKLAGKADMGQVSAAVKAALSS